MLSWSWLLEVGTVSVAELRNATTCWSANQYTVCRTAVWPWPRPVVYTLDRVSFVLLRGSDAVPGAFVDCAVDAPSDARRDPSSTDDLAGLEALAYWTHLCDRV